jgi:glyoxylase-like metal-dependent hydrolase (beta-lactamase superfamily II)
MDIDTVEIKIAGNAAFLTNCYVISKNQSADSVVVIDPGDEADVILQAIGQRKLEAIILTHGHYDHIGAVADLVTETEANVYAHHLDADSIRKDYEGIKKGFFGFSREKDNQAELDPDDATNPEPPVSFELHDGDIIRSADLNLEVLHTPGHTPGCICLYSLEDKALFSGDTLFYGTCGRTDFVGGSPQSMHDSLARLSKLPADTLVYPGHGPSTTIGREITRGLTAY